MKLWSHADEVRCACGTPPLPLAGEVTSRRVCRLICIFFTPLLLPSSTPPLRANEIVVVRSRDGNSERRVTGTILEYTGKELLIEHASGREERIPGPRIVRVVGAWSEAHRAANDSFATGDYQVAEAKYLQALREEKRPWVVRRVRAQLTWCYRYLDQTDRAAKAFFGVYAEDPETPYLAAIPLAWATNTTPPAVERQAALWMSDRNPGFVRLIGASWSLSSSRRAEALRTLTSLERDADPHVVFLARTQVWRTEAVTATAAITSEWAGQIANMPTEIRAGPLFILGQALARQKQHEQAALTFMKTAILYPAERDLTVHSLLAAGRELETMKRPQQATGLYREILGEHATSSVVAQAEQRLKELQP